MKATLTLDDDVAALLERARRERGRNLEELANELLRRTLSRLGASAVQPRQKLEAKEPEPAASMATEQPEATSLEAQIDQLYDEIRDLVVRSAENPALKAEIERKRKQLHTLQVEEAAAWRKRAEARRHLKPGEGYRLLQRAEGLLNS